MVPSHEGHAGAGVPRTAAAGHPAIAKARADREPTDDLVSVLGTLLVPGDARHVRDTREFLRKVMSGRSMDPQIGVVLLSELVTNALKWSNSGRGGSVLVTILDLGQALRVAVSDGGSATTPCLRQTTVTTEHGRGLWLVDELAARWGFERRDHETCTYFDLDVPTAGTRPEGDTSRSSSCKEEVESDT